MKSSKGKAASMATKPSIYLAASFRHSKPLMREYAQVLRGRGFVVTSRWLTSNATVDPLGDPEMCRVAAEECFDDIDASDLFVYFSEPDSVGKNIEFGYALASGAPRLIRIVVVGPPTSVFHFYPDVIRLASWKDFMAWLP